MTELAFRKIPDDQPIPDDCCGPDGEADWAALVEWICPSLEPDEAERLGAIARAELGTPTTGGLRRVIAANAGPR